MLLLTGTKREQQKMTDKEDNDKYTTFYLPSSAKNLFLSCADFLCHCLLVVVHTGEKNRVSIAVNNSSNGGGDCSAIGRL